MFVTKVFFPPEQCTTAGVQHLFLDKMYSAVQLKKNMVNIKILNMKYLLFVLI